MPDSLMRTVLGGLVVCTLAALTLHGRATGQGAGKDGGADLTKAPLDRLVADLDSVDGKVRVAATREIFRRGQDALAGLRKVGAKQVAPFGGTIAPRRLDVVYSLIQGLPPNPPGARSGYRTDSFGLHVDQGTALQDVEAMGKKYGFSPSSTFRADSRPSCYVRLDQGKALEEVMRRVLTEEPRVRTVNLNYFEG
jgi:hypothetical protein